MLKPSSDGIWSPIMPRAPSQTIPSWEEFLEHYRTHIPVVAPFTLTPISVSQLRSSLSSKMSKDSASGLDGRSVSILKPFPDRLLAKLCAMFDVIEQTQTWPESFAASFFKMFLPQPDSDHSPSSLRPMSILRVCYRLWASARLTEFEMARKLLSSFSKWFPDCKRLPRRLVSHYSQS